MMHFPQFQDLMRKLLSAPEQRLGRESFDEITSHPFFAGVDWSTIHTCMRFFDFL
jgi:protein-serine/threonine kinase